MTADPLGVVFSNKNLIWRSPLQQVGGRYADLVEQIAAELKAYNKSTMQYAQIEYLSETSTYALSFNIKKGSVKYNPTYYFTMDAPSGTQVKFSFAAEGDKMGETYVSKCPSIKTFIDALGAGVLDLKANSLLAPVNMTTAESGNQDQTLEFNLLGSMRVATTEQNHYVLDNSNQAMAKFWHLIIRFKFLLYKVIDYLLIYNYI